ncbi:transcriptional regulator with XRE-family HTH domain [Streptomyces sp. SLBN-8D4]
MSSQVAPGDDMTTGLDRRAEPREFLRSRRARLKPEDIGLPSYGRRRAPGLRREELAQLAGVSYAYYARLEQGYGETMSAEVLDAVAQALRLNEEERDHLIRLAQPGRNRIAGRAHAAAATAQRPEPPGHARRSRLRRQPPSGRPRTEPARHRRLRGLGSSAARGAEHGPADLPLS